MLGSSYNSQSLPMTQQGEQLFITDKKEYFALARRWYTAKYIRIYGDCIYLLIVSVLAIAAAIIIIDVAFAKYKRQNFFFPFYSNNSDIEELPVITSILNEYSAADFAVADYFTRRYVALRENYSPELLNVNQWTNLLTQVQQLSSAQTFDEFIHYLSPKNNPSSPVLQYRTSVSRNVTINSLKFVGRYNIPGKAIVKFTAHEQDNAGQNRETQWIAEIMFDMPSIRNILNENVTLYFNVIQYRVFPQLT